MMENCLSLLPLLLQVSAEIDPEAGEFNLFLFCFVIVALAAFCLLIAIGILVGLVAAIAMAGAGLLGIVANAIISGLACKSPRVGVTVLTFQFGGLIGLGAGLASCIAARWLLRYDPMDPVTLLLCGALGAVFGTGTAWISLGLFVAVFRQIKESCDFRLRKTAKSSAEPRPHVSTAAAASLPAADAPRGG